MTIKIGKAADNDFVINNAGVSRYHAVLRRDEAGMVIEDMGSTNGTFVNGVQIHRKRISMEDTVMLGECAVDLAAVLRSGNDYSAEFALLKDIYGEYIARKVKIQSSTTFRARLFQTLPFILPGIVGLLITFSGSGGMMLRAICVVIAIIAPASGIYLGARQAAKAPSQLQELANRFKIDYVCPKCGTFLGEIPWESLANRKVCSSSGCRAKWTE
jgi:hypothetical protein